VTAARGTPIISGGSQQQQQQSQQSQQQQQQQTNAGNPPTSPIAQPLSLQELTVRTITMTRDPPDSHHGFGICVKGGKDAGEIRSTFRLPPSPYFVPRERGTFSQQRVKLSILISSRHFSDLHKSSQASRFKPSRTSNAAIMLRTSRLVVPPPGSSGRLTVNQSGRRFLSFRSTQVRFGIGNLSDRIYICRRIFQFAFRAINRTISL